MADILIRGMEMPKDRRVELLVFPNGYVGIYDVYGRYLANARAVPLPEKHGRLGDLDKLKKLTYEIKTNRGTYQTVINIVDLLNAPTIVPAEGENIDG